MANRNWRVSGNFHTIGEVVVIVSSPNWQSGMRKGMLGLKAQPALKGRRINMASFTIVETDQPVTYPSPIQAMPVQAELVEQVAATVPPQPSTEVESVSEVPSETQTEPGSEQT